MHCGYMSSKSRLFLDTSFSFKVEQSVLHYNCSINVNLGFGILNKGIPTQSISIIYNFTSYLYIPTPRATLLTTALP